MTAVISPQQAAVIRYDFEARRLERIARAEEKARMPMHAAHTRWMAGVARRAALREASPEGGQ